MYQFPVWFWISTRQAQVFFQNLCDFIFFPCAFFFPASLLFEITSLMGCGVVAKAFLQPIQFVLQKPCFSLCCIREFCCFCVWHHRLGHLSLFAVMLIVPFLVWIFCSGKIPALQLRGLCKWHLWKRAWFLLIQHVGRCQVSHFYPAFICEILLVWGFLSTP